MLAAALYLAGILAFGLPQAFAQDVMGTVRDAGGAPISGAHVVFGQSGATPQQETMTDEAGKFSLTSQNAGTYLVRVYKDGYRDSEQSLTIPRASEVPLTVLLLKTSDSAEGSAQSQDGTEFSDKPDFAETTSFRNSSLQGGYFIIAARAIGLECGPMSGFDNDAVDREFFPGGQIRSNFICALGHGDPAGLFPRSPRPNSSSPWGRRRSSMPAHPTIPTSGSSYRAM